MKTELIDLVENLGGDENFGSRRELLGELAKQGGKIAIAAATPFLASCASIGQAVAPNRELAVQVLQFAILLEELEHDFYVQALAAPGLIPANDRAIFEQISKHEGAHVTFLNTGLTGIGGSPQAAPQFNFRGHLSSYQSFLGLAQTLEETGVGAYKGQAANLITSHSLLTAALRIHSVEARHAAEIRKLRGQTPWTGAFDEPLDKATVMGRVSPFIRGSQAHG